MEPWRTEASYTCMMINSLLVVLNKNFAFFSTYPDQPLLVWLHCPHPETRRRERERPLAGAGGQVEEDQLGAAAAAATAAAAAATAHDVFGEPQEGGQGGLSRRRRGRRHLKSEIRIQFPSS